VPGVQVAKEEHADTPLVQQGPLIESRKSNIVLLPWYSFKHISVVHDVCLAATVTKLGRELLAWEHKREDPSAYSTLLLGTKSLLAHMFGRVSAAAGA